MINRVEMITAHLVVARYNEDVSWIKQIQSDGEVEFKVFVYDKSNSPNQAFIVRPNVGREVSSFFEHIILNYHQLPDYVILCQGDPFPHVKANKTSFLDKLKQALLTKPETTQPLLTNWYVESPYVYPSLPVKDYYRYFFDSDIPSMWTFAAGCQYIIPKDIILNRAKQFYCVIQSMTLLGDKFTFNKAHFSSYQFNSFEINGWTLERLLGTVFSKTPVNQSLIQTKRYLVTGGCGFIGSNLAQTLSKDSIVFVIDNLSTGSRENLCVNENIYLHVGDILQTNFTSLFGYVDGIFHLAAMSKVLPSMDVNMVEFCLQQNANGTINLLKYANSHIPAIKVVYSASSTYYGNNSVPNHESNLPDCQTPYAVSKYIGELYCELFLLYIVFQLYDYATSWSLDHTNHLQDLTQ